MKSKVLCIVVLVHLAAMGLFAQTTEFTYQGNLNNNGTAAHGSYDFEFRLFDALIGVAQAGPTLTRSNTPVTNGVFSVLLDFGPVFPGANRFMQILARTNGAPVYVQLDPRQKLTSAPFAIRSLGAGTSDALSANCTLCVTDAHIQALNGNKIADGTVITSKLASGGSHRGQTFSGVDHINAASTCSGGVSEVGPAQTPNGSHCGYEPLSAGIRRSKYLGDEPVQ